MFGDVSGVSQNSRLSNTWFTDKDEDEDEVSSSYAAVIHVSTKPTATEKLAFGKVGHTAPGAE